MKNQKGFSVVQVLVSSAIVLTVAAAALTQQSHMRKFQSRMVAGITRTGLAETLRFNASNPLTIYKSAVLHSTIEQNSQLAACVCGESTCKQNETLAFDLMDVTGRIVAGAGNQAAKYNNLTEYCTTPSCTFEGLAQFSCTGDKCGTSQVLGGNPSLRVSYNLKLTDEAVNNQEAYSYLKQIRGEVSVLVSDVKAYGMKNDICVTGSSFSPTYGYTSGGDLITITGTGLQRVKSVLFANSPCMITSKSTKSLYCTNPSHAEGAVAVTLVYGQGERYQLPGVFMYYPEPPPPPPPPPGSGFICGNGMWSKEAVLGPCSGAPSGSCCDIGKVTFACGSWFECQK